MKILVLNAGSSSQKSCLYEIVDPSSSTPPTLLWATDASWPQKKGVAELKITANGQTIIQELLTEELSNSIKPMLKTLWSGRTQVITQPTEIDIVGHRVVHGGPHYHQSVLITPDVKAEIERLASFAPLHNPENLKVIEATECMLLQYPTTDRREKFWNGILDFSTSKMFVTEPYREQPFVSGFAVRRVGQ